MTSAEYLDYQDVLNRYSAWQDRLHTMRITERANVGRRRAGTA